MSEAENIARARYARGEITKQQLDEILAGLAESAPRLAESADAKTLAKAKESHNLSLYLLGMAAFLFLMIVLIPDPAGMNPLLWMFLLLCLVVSFVLFISSKMKA